jgi:predicted MFS family arabinose efflux permease
MLLKPTVWLAVVSFVFVKSRGMATAVTLCGTALAQTFVPLLSYFLIEHFGWRAAYAMLGCGWGGLAMILVLMFFHDPADRRPATKVPTASKEPAETLPGLSIREAVRCLALYRVAASLAIYSAISIAVITHNVAIFGELGISRVGAAQIAATAGIAGVVGKLAAGWCYDRSASSWIGFSAYALAALGFFVLLTRPSHNPALLVLAMIFIGLSAGAALQVAMYLTGRYCGMRNFGKVFGVKTSLLAIGMGLGPVLGGFIRDHFGSYHPLFMLGVPAALFCGLLVSRLGPYPDWEARANAAGGPSPPQRGAPAGLKNAADMV